MPTQYVPDILGRTAQIIQVDPDGSGPLPVLITKMRYDYRSNLVEHVDPRGVTQRFNYDDNDRLVSQFDGLGVGMRWTFDASDNITESFDGSGTWATLYDVAGKPFASIDPLGRTTRTLYDGNGQVRQTIDPRGAVTSMNYDVDGLLLSVKDARELTTGYTYDDHDRLSTIVYQGDSGQFRTEHFYYDAADQLVGQIDPENNFLGQHTIPATVFTYDGDGQLSRVVELSSASLNFQTVPASQYDAIVDALPVNNRRITEFQYDNLGRTTDTIYNDGTSRHFAYDVLSRVQHETDERGGITSYDYDDVGWLRTVTLPDPDLSGSQTSPIWKYSWDASGNAVNVTDPNNLHTSRVYDLGNRLTSETDAGNGIATFTYDATGRHISTTDQRGFTSSLAYDAASQLIRTATPDPDGAGPLAAMTVDYAYDLSGNLASAIDDLGREDTYEYDLYGRITKWQQPAASSGELRPTHQWFYGQGTFEPLDKGQFDSVTYVDPIGKLERSFFDARGLVHKKKDLNLGGYEIYKYDQFNQLTSTLTYGSTNVTFPGESSTNLPDELLQSTGFKYDEIGQLIEVNTSRIDLGANLYAIPFIPQHTVQYNYDDAGNLTSFIDNTGAETQTYYDFLSRPVTVISGFGTADASIVSYTYDAGNRLTDMIDPGGFVTQYEYDTLNRLKTQIENVGQSLQRSMSWTYDARGNLKTATDAVGTVTQWNYDALGRPTLQTDDLGGVEQRTSLMAYDQAGNMESFVNGRGDQLAWTFDDLDRMTSETVGAGTADALTWQFGYNLIGERTSSVHPDQTITQMTYNGGSIASVTEDFGGPDQSITNYVYDSRKFRMGVSLLQGPTGRSNSLTTYDGLGREVLFVQAIGTSDEVTTQTIYDDAARTLTMIDGEQNASVSTYDALGRLKQWRGPDPDAGGPQLPVQIDYTYNTRGQRTTMTERLTATQNSITDYVIDSLGRTTASIEIVLDPIHSMVARQTNMQYDSRDLLTQVTDPSGETLTYTYDALRRVETFDDGAGRVLNYDYDAAGNLIDVTSPLTHFVYDFDTLGRMKSETRSTPGQSNEYFVHQYDPIDGRLESVTLNRGVITNAVSREEFDYDHLGRIVDQRTLDLDDTSQPIVRQHFQFDDAGNLTDRFQYRISATTGVETLERSIHHDIDFLGRRAGTTELEAGNVQVFDADFVYDDRNLLTDVVRKNAAGATILTTSYEFDDAGRLKSLRHFSPATTLSQYDYTRDASGRITDINSSKDGLVQYTYNTADELRSESRNGTVIETYDWDLAGNRLETGTIIGPGNRLLADQQFTYAYDAEGRRTSRTDKVTNQHTTYKYDAAGRIISTDGFTSSGAFQSTFSTDTTYDAVGRRSSELTIDYDNYGYYEGSEEVWFNYEGWNTTSIRSSTGSLLNSYVHGPMTDQVLADIAYTSTGATKPALYTLGDHQGTIKDFAAVDAAIGSIASVGHRDYDAFGLLRSSNYATGSASPTVAEAAVTAADHLFAYTGREQTGTKDVYDYRMRSYDAKNGRFLQPDPMGLRAGDTNLFRYVGSDAVNYIDPLGLEGEPAGGGCNTVNPDGGTSEGGNCGGGAQTTTRYAAGAPDCSCSCACETQAAQGAQAGAMQTGASPIVPSTSSGSAPTIPSSILRSGSKDPMSQTPNGRSNPAALLGNPINTIDPSGNTAFSQDPIGFAAGDANLYRYVGNMPTMHTDPTGLILPLIALGAAAGANYWAWGNNAQAVDDLINDRPIDYRNTPYSGAYWKGGAKHTAMGAGVGGAFALAPQCTVPYLATGAGAVGVAVEAPQAYRDYSDGNYVSGTFHLGMGGLSAYGGYRGGIGRPRLPQNQESVAGVLTLEESMGTGVIIVDEALANSGGYLTQSFVLPINPATAARPGFGPFVHGLQNPSAIGSILGGNHLFGRSPVGSNAAPAVRAQGRSPLGLNECPGDPSKVLLEFYTDTPPRPLVRGQGWSYDGDLRLSPDPFGIQIRPSGVRTPSGQDFWIGPNGEIVPVIRPLEVQRGR